MCSLRILSSTLATLGFLWYYSVSTGKFRAIRRFLLDPFQFVVFIHPTIWWKIVAILNSCKNKPTKDTILGNVYHTAWLQTRSNLIMNGAPKFQNSMLLKNWLKDRRGGEKMHLCFPINIKLATLNGLKPLVISGILATEKESAP
jgi:hypothetical protein